MTNIEKLRSAIIEAVPEIMELKFGCRIKEKPAFGSALRNKTWMGEKVFTLISTTRPMEGWLVATDGGFCPVKTSEIEKWHIVLGRPITLADVLRAIGLENFHNNDKIPELIYGYHHSWNLAKDNLDDQSPETIDFLTSVLCNG